MKSLTNQHRFYYYTTFHFILQTVIFYIQLTSTKSKFPVCANFFQFTKKYGKNFWRKQTSIVTFITTFWTIHSPIVEFFDLAKDPTKNLLRSKCFIFAVQTYSNDLFSWKKSAFPKRKLSLYSTAWVQFSKFLIKPTKYRRFHYPNLDLRFNLQKQKTICSVIVART